MITRVIKRDGRKAVFSKRRIQESVSACMKESGESRYGVINNVVDTIINAINVIFPDEKYIPKIEEVQNVIVSVLKEMELEKSAEAFENYREERTQVRETKSEVMKAIAKIGEETDRDNANVGNNFSAKLLQIASVANKWHNLATMPKNHAKMHENGDWHIHDLDSFNLTVNCLHVDLEKSFNDGFNTGYGFISKPKRLSSAGELSCIILQSTQNDMFGGQAFPDFDNTFSQFVKADREEALSDITGTFGYVRESVDCAINAERTKEAIEMRVNKNLHQTMQGVVYNLNTMHSRAGSQVPFSSINIGYVKDDDAALVCQAFLEEYDKGLGKGEQPIFPNIIFRLKKGLNANPEDPYYYLRVLAEKVAAKRMNPTFRNLDSSACAPFVARGIIPATMGCRTEVCANINGEEGPNGRGNIAPISLNLPRVGIESKTNWDKFYKNLDKIMDDACEELLYRKSVLAKLKVKDLPFVAGQKFMKGSENLSPDDSIEEILRQGSWGIGFIGLAETMIAMTGHHHGEGQEYWNTAYEIVTFMRAKVDSYKEKHQLNFSLYATPAEGLSGRFTAIDKKKYGDIPGITDKGYYTNSYHIPVKYSISFIDKINAEAPFHKLCNAGKISYGEIDGGSIEERFNFIHRGNDYIINNTDTDYWGWNFHIRYCKDCGEHLEGGEQVCPKCGSQNIQGVSRVTGYMSLDERFGPGKTKERADRTKHEV